MGIEIIGWVSNLLLLATMSRQVWSQWTSGSSRGVSSWLFVGQLATSVGFVTYSYLLGNWVFVTSNLLLIVVAGLGQWIYLRNRRRGASDADAPVSGYEPRPPRSVVSSSSR